jgi:hypothetical protein
MAALASGDYVLRVQADRVTVAKVGYGQDDFAVGEVGGTVVQLGASA